MAFYISRIKKRKEITFDVEVITPMFLGSADQKKAELRASSIKGLMRFWWRAINGTRNILPSPQGSKRLMKSSVGRDPEVQLKAEEQDDNRRAVGRVVYQGDNLGRFLPFLKYCEKIHLGKQTFFGLGKIRLERKIQ